MSSTSLVANNSERFKITSLLSDYSLTGSHRGIGDYSSIGGSFNHGGLNSAMEEYGDMDENCTDDESLPDDNTVFGIRKGDGKNQPRELLSEQPHTQPDKPLGENKTIIQEGLNTSSSADISNSDTQSVQTEKPCVPIAFPDALAAKARCGVPLESGISLAIAVKLRSDKSTYLQRQDIFVECTWEYIWDSDSPLNVTAINSNATTIPVDITMKRNTSTVCIESQNNNICGMMFFFFFHLTCVVRSLILTLNSHFHRFSFIPSKT